MNSAFNLSAIACLLFGSAFAANAEQCASVGISQYHVAQQSYALKISKIDGQPQQEHAYFYLTPGFHRITVEQTVNEEDNDTTKLIHAGLQTEAGMQYTLALSGTAKAPKIVIIDRQTIDCDKPANELVASRPADQAPPLPPELDYRLRQVMTEIAAYHKLKGESNANNSVPGKQLATFGVVFDEQPYRKSQRLKVLAVTPFSQANQLGLASGDEILSLGGKPPATDKDNADSVLGDYLAGLSPRQNIEMTVRRKSQTLTLSNPFKPVITPDVRYHIGQ